MKNLIVLFLLTNGSCFAMDINKELNDVSLAMEAAYKIICPPHKEWDDFIMNKLKTRFEKLIRYVPKSNNISLGTISQAMLILKDQQRGFEFYDDFDNYYDSQKVYSKTTDKNYKNLMNILKTRFKLLVSSLPK